MIVKNRIEKIIATIMFAVIYGLIIKYTNIDVAIVCLLIQIYVELLLKENQTAIENIKINDKTII